MSAVTLGVLLVLLSGVIEGVAQVCFKKAAMAAGRRRGWIGAGIALFVAQALLYTGALDLVELSTAFPILSIGFVVVTVLSRGLLREPVTRERWIGVALIMAGVALLGAHA